MARSIPRGFVYVHVSIHESERKYIKVERISFYKLNFELRPEIKLKGIRSCIVMDYKTWNNGTEWRFNTVWKFTGNDVVRCSDHFLPRSTRESLFLLFEKEVNDTRWFVKVLSEGKKNTRKMDDWNTSKRMLMNLALRIFLMHLSCMLVIYFSCNDIGNRITNRNAYICTSSSLFFFYL